MGSRTSPLAYKAQGRLKKREPRPVEYRRPSDIGALCGLQRHSGRCHLPQIHKAAIDKNGASSVSFMAWMLFLRAHLSTVAYALVNRSS